jgi:hypothetical protein
METAQRGQFLFGGPLGCKRGDSMARQEAAGLRQRHTGLPTPLQQAAAALRLESREPPRKRRGWLKCNISAARKKLRCRATAANRRSRWKFSDITAGYRHL